MAELTTNVHIDHEAVLKAVGLNVRDPNAQALLLTCQRYGLDPVLKHMVLIQNRPYVTRDGLLHVAHQSGKFDGIEVLEIGETQTHYTAKVAVYRKDMGRPFTYPGRYPKSGGNKFYGPEMAIKTAECMALRRAFNVALCAREEVWEQDVEAEDVSVREYRDHERRPTMIPSRKSNDDRTLAKLIQDGVDSTNAEFSKDHDPGEVIVNGFEVQRHLLKTAIAEQRVTPGPGKITQAQCYSILEAHYAIPDGRLWIRRELSRYLGDRLIQARIAAYKDRVEAPVIEDEVKAEETAPAEREPGEEG